MKAYNENMIKVPLPCKVLFFYTCYLLPIMLILFHITTHQILKYRKSSIQDSFFRQYSVATINGMLLRLHIHRKTLLIVTININMYWNIQDDVYVSWEKLGEKGEWKMGTTSTVSGRRTTEPSENASSLFDNHSERSSRRRAC